MKTSEIWRDEHGVCHIASDNKMDVFRLMGFAHAIDRGMQMLLMRILGQGRASEILDASEEMLAIDTFFRRMDWNGSMDLQIDALSPEARKLTEAYCAGANQAFSEKRPWECRLFGYRPEPWSARDVILISRMVGYLTLAQSQGEMERLLIELIQAGLDQERLDELFPGILGDLDVELIKKIDLQERLVAPPSLWNLAIPAAMASNNWAVSGQKTASGMPILANDPHLEVNRLPNVWYEVVLKIAGRWAMGANMPGVPALLIGRNPDLAWGATYTFMDATDSWIEKCKDGCYWREPEGWVPFKKRTEIIRRKKKAPVTVTFYENPHGILEGDPQREGLYLATAWAPSFSGAQTVNSLVKMFETRSVAEGMDLLGQVETSWNWVLADSQGNIGYQMSGLMPKRRPEVSGFVPLPGWEPQNDWHGFERHTDLPRCLNPDCGYFVTANQNLNAYSSLEPINAGMGAYRSDRISNRLATADGLTPEDMYRLQHDLYSAQAERFMEILAPLLPDTANGRILKEWNLEYDAASKGAFLFDRIYRELYRQVFGAGLGSAAVDHIERHTGIFNDFFINFDRILLADRSAWFGDRTREAIYRDAAAKALDVAPKAWGETRRVTLKNIVFDGRLPKFFGFDRGPVTLPGSLATPHQGQVFESAGRQTTFAPSFRMVIDLAEEEIHTSMAGGPSDRRFSKWYVSDLENWTKGRYKRLKIAPDPGHRPFK
ncbi:penicillin acylase family protein [Desulfosarcina sp.]|uniref:penicillin acylase family protein n=1 Tax=Desulfosarcina sp. TaxID=2027861 RepID=UPI003970D895